MTSGKILRLQRLSTEDGPGIRTTVFFKGCPLRCDWCHNPESISSRLQIQWFSTRCLGCKTCVETCPNGCLALTENGIVVNRETCQACGKCAEACPSGALETTGRTVTANWLASELLKDRAYYEKSGGGVTLSGGEPTFQPEFAEALLRKLKENGVSAALDTCGLCSRQTLDRLLLRADLILFDLKLFDPALHQKFTGATNEQILENLECVRNYIHSQERHIALWIRTPLIPGATATTDNLTAIGRHLADKLNGTVSRWELCSFNNLCRDQYARLGLSWRYAQTPLMTREDLAHCEQAAKSSGICPDIVLVTGAARVMEAN